MTLFTIINLIFTIRNYQQVYYYTTTILLTILLYYYKTKKECIRGLCITYVVYTCRGGRHG